MPTPRRLVVMRHAKAEASAPSDVERELAERGRADAAEAGAWLAAQGDAPDRALVSAAVRTRQTWEAVASAAAWDVDATYDEGLYDAGPETALDLLGAVPSSYNSVLLLGHNPTMGQLAALLDDGDGDPAAANEMVLGFPTCALAVMTYHGEWADLAPATATVTAFHVGRAH